jgi:tetraacyldisaccharide 4'-kinase
MSFLLRILLFPITIIYWMVTALRNHLFDINYSRSFQFEPHVINIGNLSVGGSGKTPTVEYLIRLLKDKYVLATLSRGYRRTTKGFRLADQNDNYLSIGDEPFQYYSKFGHQVSVAVGEDRALAIPSILLERDNTQVILLDDAYQHRTVKPDLNILLTEFKKPFTSDYVLPSGRLRESRNGARRADIVLVTKCPEYVDASVQERLAQEIRKYSGPEVPVFFTRIRSAQY